MHADLNCPLDDHCLALEYPIYHQKWMIGMNTDKDKY